ncbi:hypothetical protein AKG08_08165 [Achromobacter piechaudii]|uniref:anti-sigma factor n=1 Tax=Achromobacter piechaudii TaxID=72556 RepID=UPI0006813A28|nr:hypothetical protein [Achromobacter piechaudii]KNY11631.1 hypothetical protein AKG08_08165 [Achromobacter piechaudii]
MSEDRVLSYLSGEMTPDEHRVFEAELARDPALQAEVDEWRLLAQARQIAHNEIGQAERDTQFLRTLAEQARPAPAAPPKRSRLWQWLWPTPASPLMPLGWALAIALSVVVMQQAPSDSGMSDGVLTRGGGACPRLVVDLPDTVTARQLRNALSQYAVSIVSGPDEDGRFVLSAARESSLHDAARALGAVTVAPAAAGACVTP